MLLAIPITSLVGLWGFAATVTVGDSVSLLTVGRLYSSIGTAAGDLSAALQREHILSAEYLATRSAADRDTLAGQRVVSDQARTRFRRATSTEEVQSSMSAETKARYDELMKRVDAVGAVRAKVDDGRIGPMGLSREFALVPDALHRLYVTVSLSEDLPLYRQVRGIEMIGQAKDLLSRERALATGALALRQPMTDDELRLFTRLAGNRAFLMEQALSELEPELRGPFTELAVSPLYARFTDMENRLLGGSTVSPAEWRTAGDDLDAFYQRSLTEAGVALGERAAPSATATFVRAGVAAVLGLLAVAASLLVSYRIGSGLTRELAGLRRAAADLAEVRLPQIMERLRRGERVDVTAEAPTLEPLGSTVEVHDVAVAFDSVRRSALDAAVEQARLRDGVSQAFRNLARRSQSLLQRQLKLLDGMQTQAEDPETLDGLFQLDHLTTRMRRHAEGLVILSGGASGRKWRSAVHMEDVLRGAAAQVEDYARVRIFPMGGATLVGNAAADMTHLFAEIIENATVFSPPDSLVSIRGELVGRGFVVEIEDRGLGLTAEKRAAINERLASPPEFDPAETDRLGFTVVGLLAARYKVDVTLRPSPYGGTGVVVLLPEELLGDPEPVDPPVLTVLPEPSATPVVPRRAGPAVPVPADLWRPTRRGGGLPRRTRQADAPPRPVEKPRLSGVEARERSPEEARALMSALQSGWQRGRAEDGDGGDER
ncbi:hypothetical protein GCM10010517_08120 [Streptosporangium fragile]|uniref:histidine kinase n=1 Tax=Streptosporangium fragile TaxID=46186 RepID=A0ABN3VQQ5_9ACTN